MDIDGEDLRGFPIYIDNGIYGRSPAVGDLDGDGDTEIVILDNSANITYAFDLDVPKTELPDWPMVERSPLGRGPCTVLE